MTEEQWRALPLRELQARVEVAFLTNRTINLGMFAPLDALWRGITDPTAIDDETLQRVIDLAATGFDEFFEMRGSTGTFAEARRVNNLDYARGHSRRGTLVSPQNISVTAPTVQRMILDPLGNLDTQKSVRIPAINLQLLRTLEQTLNTEPYKSQLAELHAVDARGRPGLAGAVFGLALFQRLLAAQQAALLQTIVNSPMEVSSETLRALMSEIRKAPPKNWHDLFWGYFDETSGQFVAGLREVQSARDLWMAPLSRAAFYYHGGIQAYEGNWALIAWLTGTELFDRGVIDASHAPKNLLLAAAQYEPRALDAVMRFASRVLSPERIVELDAEWNAARGTTEANHERVTRYLKRLRQADLALVPDMLAQAGGVFWVPEYELFARVTGDYAIYTTAGQAFQAGDISGLEVRWFARTEDGMAAKLTGRRPATDSSGLEVVALNVAAKQLVGDSGTWRRVGTMPHDVALLKFNRSIDDWLAESDPDPLQIEGSGNAPPPPDELAQWATTLHGDMYREAGTDGYFSLAIPETTTGTRVRVEGRLFAGQIRAGRPVAQHVEGRMLPTPLAIWSGRATGDYQRKGKLDRDPGDVEVVELPESASGPDAVLRVSWVRKRRAVLPVEIADGDEAVGWVDAQVGDVWRVAGQEGDAFVVVRSEVVSSQGYPMVRVARFKATETEQGVWLDANSSPGSRPTSPIRALQLWDTRRDGTAHRVGRVTMLRSSSQFPGDWELLGTPKQIIVPRGLWNEGIRVGAAVPRLDVNARFRVPKPIRVSSVDVLHRLGRRVVLEGRQRADFDGLDRASGISMRSSDPAVRAAGAVASVFTSNHSGVLTSLSDPEVAAVVRKQFDRAIARPGEDAGGFWRWASRNASPHSSGLSTLQQAAAAAGVLHGPQSRKISLSRAITEAHERSAAASREGHHTDAAAANQHLVVALISAGQRDVERIPPESRAAIGRHLSTHGLIPAVAHGRAFIGKVLAAPPATERIPRVDNERRAQYAQATRTITREFGGPDDGRDHASPLGPPPREPEGTASLSPAGASPPAARTGHRDLSALTSRAAEPLVDKDHDAPGSPTVTPASGTEHRDDEPKVPARPSPNAAPPAAPPRRTSVTVPEAPSPGDEPITQLLPSPAIAAPATGQSR